MLSPIAPIPNAPWFSSDFWDFGPIISHFLTYLPTEVGWKTELIKMVGYIRVTIQVVTGPSVEKLVIKTKALGLYAVTQ